MNSILKVGLCTSDLGSSATKIFKREALSGESKRFENFPGLSF